MKMKLYDPIFDNLVVEQAVLTDFKKVEAVDVIKLGLEEEQYITYEQLEEYFGLSQYQIFSYLEQIGAKPIGIKKNIVDGKRLRGVGKHVFAIEVVERIEEVLHSDINVLEIKAMAAKIKEGILKKHESI